MKSDYGNDFITVTDDEGNEFELEHLGTMEYGGELYMAFLPADMDEDEDDFGMVIFKVVEEDGEEIFATVDDEILLMEVHKQFVEILSDDE